MQKHTVMNVEEGSIADEVGIEKGDILLSMNGLEIQDVLDYSFLEKDEELEMVFYRPSTNEEWEIFIEKEVFDELGLDFDSGLMDDYKSCHNKCVFCFIDQLPEGMRETLYFKDDDARLSFLQGNYITMTNMKEQDFSRIIDYRLSPINLSIHTMNMDLRCKMLKNRFAGKLLDYMNRMLDAGIYMNGQIVLCKGINDGEELDYSIREMMKYMPFLQSVSIVPVGLTKFRKHLEKLEPFSSRDAIEVIETVERYQKIAMDRHGSHFVHAGDEFYFLAGLEVPDEDRYDGYLQYENGVGMTRLLKDEFDGCYNSFDFQNDIRDFDKVTFATGMLFEPVIRKMADRMMLLETAPEIQVIGIVNDYFGHRITVSGLVTGKDIIAQLKDMDLGDRIYIPDNMLKSDEDVFLDNITLDELSTSLNQTVVPLPLKGKTLLKAMSGKEI